MPVDDPVLLIVGERGRREPIEAGLRARGDEVERDHLGVRMLDRRARGLALVDERLRVAPPVREVEPGAVTQCDHHVGGRVRGERAGVGIVCGGEDDDFVRAGDAVTDDGVLVRDDPQGPARRVGRSGAEPCDLGRRLVLVVAAERTRRDARGQWFGVHAERVGPKRSRRREDHSIAGELVDQELLHGTVRVGGPRRVAWTAWPCDW